MYIYVHLQPFQGVAESKQDHHAGLVLLFFRDFRLSRTMKHGTDLYIYI